MVYSQVSIEESLRVKKLLYLSSEVNEYYGTSLPLNELVLSTILAVTAGNKLSSKKLKTGYIVDLSREGGFSPCAVIMALLYIQRLANSNPSFFTTLSSRELFLVAMLVASKYLNDEGEMEALTNSDIATLGSISRDRLDLLEIRFLQAIDWRLFVSLEEYYQFVASVEGRVALSEACKRGWFSYTDLCAVWDSTNIQTDMTAASKTTAKVTYGSALLYLVCIATLFTSTVPACHGNDLCTSTLSTSNESSSTNTGDTFTTNATISSEFTPNFSSKPPSVPPLQKSASDLEKNPQNGLLENGMFDNAMDYNNVNDTLPSNRYLDSGLVLLLNLTALLTSPDLSASDTVNPISSPEQFNPLVSELIHSDKPCNSASLSYQNSSSSTNFGKIFGKNDKFFNPIMPEYNHMENAKISSESIQSEEQSYLTKLVQNDLDFTKNEQYLPHVKYRQSPVVVIETLPTVSEPFRWDYNIPFKVEDKSNFTVIGVLSMLAHSMLAW